MAQDGDITLVIGNDVVSEVMERYFNEEMFKKVIKIVHMTPSEKGIVFTMSYDERKSGIIVSNGSGKERKSVMVKKGEMV
jgi:hypothetical protein